MKKKRCTQCKKLKLLDEFYLIHHGKHRMAECKKCYGTRVNNHRKSHLERFRIVKQQYVARDPERWAKFAKEWQQEHRELMCVRVKVGYWKQKLKNDFLIDVKVDTKKKTLEQIEKICLKLKKMYQEKRCLNAL
jgi:hypothetical protein